MTPSHVRYRAAPRPDLRRELSQISRGPSRTEARAQDAEAIADTFERLRVRGLLHPELELVGAARLADQPLLGAFEREPLLVQERLDALDQLKVARAIQTLARRILLGPKQLELRLPVAKDVGRDTGDRFAGLGIPSTPRRFAADTEMTEADDLHVLALLETAEDDVEHGFDHRGRLPLRKSVV